VVVLVEGVLDKKKYIQVKSGFEIRNNANHEKNILILILCISFSIFGQTKESDFLTL
jgi:hypothetical protein